MSLIPQDELTTLRPASEVKTVSETAEYEQEKLAVAHIINSAANTGETCAIVNHRLSDALITELKNNGYTLSYTVSRVNITDEVVISWDS